MIRDGNPGGESANNCDDGGIIVPPQAQLDELAATAADDMMPSTVRDRCRALLDHYVAFDAWIDGTIIQRAPVGTFNRIMCALWPSQLAAARTLRRYCAGVDDERELDAAFGSLRRALLRAMNEEI